MVDVKTTTLLMNGIIPLDMADHIHTIIIRDMKNTIQGDLNLITIFIIISIILADRTINPYKIRFENISRILKKIQKELNPKFNLWIFSELFHDTKQLGGLTSILLPVKH